MPKNTKNSASRRADTVRKRYKSAKSRLEKEPESAQRNAAIRGLDKRIDALSAKNRPKDEKELSAFLDRQESYSEIFKKKNDNLRLADDALLADQDLARAFFASTKQIWYQDGSDVASYEERKDIVLDAFQSVGSALGRAFKSLADVMEWIGDATGISFFSEGASEMWERYRELQRKAAAVISREFNKAGYKWQ